MMLRFTLLSLAGLGCSVAQAEIIQIPNTSGFSGFVMGGVSQLDYATNFYKGPDGNATHGGLNREPASQSAWRGAFNADLRYTFADSRRQLFLGNLVQDAVRFDFTQQFGLRQQIGDQGIVALSYVFTLKPIQTWDNPFATDHRDATDMSSNGLRLSWDQVAGSGLNASYTYRNIDIEHERSPEGLDRNGGVHRFDFNWDIKMGAGQMLTPGISYTDAKLDGYAARYQSAALSLGYALKGPQWSLVANGYLGQRKYAHDNPLYGQRADANEYGINGTFFWHRLLRVDALTGFVSAGYSRSDADIAFYDADVRSVSTGVMYHF